jgi:hypothetical protein
VDRLTDRKVTIFLCGQVKDCEHDYSDYQEIVEDGKVIGGTAVCVKCGQTAYEEAQWL